MQRLTLGNTLSGSALALAVAWVLSVKPLAAATARGESPENG